MTGQMELRWICTPGNLSSSRCIICCAPSSASLEVMQIIRDEQGIGMLHASLQAAFDFRRLHALLGKLMRTERQITLDIYGSIRVDERQ